MKKLIILPFLLFMVSCSSMFAPKVNLEEKYPIEEQDIRNWDETISYIIERESLIEDWYGGDNPIYYLRKTGKMKEKEFNFLQSLEKKKTITEDDRKEFNKLVRKYVKKVDRTFRLKNENLKNPKALVDKMVAESMGTRIDNPSRHILEVVASEKEKERIVAWSKQTTLSDKDVKRLRKLLNKFIKREEFFDVKSWQNREMSGRLEEIIEISERGKTTKDQRNNVNAKAMYIAYEEYLSELEKWR
ncbi:hypothetical protein PM10SUCC1_20030 [Propionigenium maris DSM 9537]|uniref:Lipoprotein n=1 Tax=Propionigenium maris DSM 9537 TaxID=1123000 RepID=A0A9W6GMD9_9FUSO|nr:hypothetical protein [Propionigenium maris]GLI56489.1 hypothetical protein PM10SUCC1_20030 [Propionigenium maris DSM 9537]